MRLPRLLLLFFFISFQQAWADNKPAELLEAIIKVRSIVPKEAHTANSLGTEREGNGVVIDSNGLILTIGYLILEAESIEVIDVSKELGLEYTDGWYNTVRASDFNNDGNIDLLVGNHGLNSRFRASRQEPIELLVGDLDNSGTYEQIISMYSNGKKYPFVQLKELAKQIPIIAQRYSSFNDYKYDETNNIFPEETLNNVKRFYSYNLASGIFFNMDSKMSFKKLPAKAQFSPIYAVQVLDFNDDENLDILLGGNFIEAKPEVGTYMASFGTLLQGIGDGQFRYISNSNAGFKIRGNIRDIEELEIGNKKVIVFTRNNHEIYKVEYVEK